MKFARCLIGLMLLFLPATGQARYSDSLRTLRVGIFPLEPLNFFDKDGEAQGINPDLLRELVRDQREWELEFVPVNWAEGLDKLQTEEIDLMVSVAYTPERAQTMDYNGSPVLEFWGQAFVRSGHTISHISELDGKKVGIMKKDLSGDNFVRLIKDFGISCEIIEYASHEDVLKAVHSEEVFAGITPHHFGLRHAHLYNLKGSPVQFSPFSVYFASKKGRQQEFLAEIDFHLGRWKHDQKSYYYDRLDYWLTANQPDLGRNPLWVWIVGCVIGGSAVLLFGANRILQHHVAKRTAELRTSELCFHGLFEHMLAGCVIYDAVNDGEDFEIRHINQIAEGYVRWSRDEVIGRLVSEAFPGVVEMGLLDQIRRVWRTGTPESHPGANYKDDRLDEWIENHIFKLPSGQVAAIYFLITERLKTERKLLESEERFEIAADAGEIGIWDRDIANDQLIWDDRMMKIYGIRKEEFGGAYEAWAQCIHPEDQEQAEAAVKAAEQGEKTFDTRFRIIRPDGSTRHIRAFGKVIRDETGRPVRMIGTNQDITCQTEEEGRFRMLFANMRIGGAIYDPVDDGNDFVFADINLAGLTQSKLEKEEIIGKRVTAIFPGVREMGLFEVLQRVWQTGTPEKLPAAFYNDSRMKQWMENYVFKLPNDQIVAIYNNITERKQAEEALRESEAEFRSTIEDLQVGVVVHDADSRVVLSNAQACQLLGLTAEQIAGKTATDPAWCFVHEDLSVMQVSDYPVNRVIATGEQIAEMTLGIRRPDREKITWVLVSAVPVFTQQHQLTRVIVNFMDITARKRAERELRERNNELERFNQSAVGRELRMIELKEEINALCRELGKPEVYG